MDTVRGRKMTRDLAPPAEPKRRKPREGTTGAVEGGAAPRKYPPELVRRISLRYAAIVQMGYKTGRTEIVGSVARQLGIDFDAVLYVVTNYTLNNRGLS